MANTPTRLAATAVPTASTVVFTATSKSILTEIIVVNTADIDATMSIALTPSGGTALDLHNDVAIPANGYLQQGLKLVVDTGDTISVIGGAAGMNIFMSGVVIT